MDHDEFFHELPRLAPGAADIFHLEDQGQGMEIIDELIIDFAIKLPGPPVLRGQSRKRAGLAGRLIAEIRASGLAGVAIDLGPAESPGYELPEGFVFFSPASVSGPASVMESPSQASRIATFTALGSFNFISWVQGTSLPVRGDLTAFQFTII